VIEAILPGAAIGVLGSGQLGRMFAIARAAHGVSGAYLFPRTRDTPTGQIADVEVVAPLRRPGSSGEFRAQRERGDL